MKGKKKGVCASSEISIWCHMPFWRGFCFVLNSHIHPGAGDYQIWNAWITLTTTLLHMHGNERGDAGGMRMICLCCSPWLLAGRQLFVLLMGDNPSSECPLWALIQLCSLQAPLIGSNSRFLPPLKKKKINQSQIFWFLQSVSKTVSLLFIPLQPHLVCRKLCWTLMSESFVPWEQTCLGRPGPDHGKNANESQ